jgi:glutamate--cysteine ligase
LIPYLFGASPAVHPSFVQGRATDLIPLDAGTLYAPYATSLRMGDIGYQNHQEECTGIKANYDSLDAYIRSLTWAIETTCPLYEQIGVKVGDRYEQLSAAILQIENEYYSTVRPKQICDWLEKPSLALRRRGIRYVELRSLDVNLFEPVGVGMEPLLFLETLMLYGVLCPSPRIGGAERTEIDSNQVLAAQRGREPGLCLSRDGAPVALSTWAMDLLADLSPAAALLDGAADGPRVATLEAQRAKVVDPDLTPSARVLAVLRDDRESFTDLARRLSLAHRAASAARTLAPKRETEFADLAAESVRRRLEIEAADDQDFDHFLAAYFAQGRAVE